MQELVVPERTIESTNEIFFSFFFGLKPHKSKRRRRGGHGIHHMESLKKRGLIKWKANLMILWRTFFGFGIYTLEGK
jgi:hypothetical protein